MLIMIEVRNVYGEPKAYPQNDVAKHFAAIANTKTLTRHTLMHVLAMGGTIVELDRYGKPCARHEAGTGTIPAIN